MFDISDVEFITSEDNNEYPVWTLTCRNDDDKIMGISKQRVKKLVVEL
jgi:hypothetical protein